MVGERGGEGAGGRVGRGADLLEPLAQPRALRGELAARTGGFVALAKAGASTLTLSGVNTYTGGTVVNAAPAPQGGHDLLVVLPISTVEQDATIHYKDDNGLCVSLQ